MVLGLLLTGGVLGYASICGLVYANQDKLTYFPSSDILVTPAQQQLEFEEFELELEDSSVTGWVVRSDEEAPWVIHFHGNGGNISARVDHLKLLHDLGLNAVVFDYRGYGKSRGVPSESGLIEDGLAVRNHLEEQLGVQPEKLVYFGESLGGGVACGVAAVKAPARLILKSTFTSIPDRGAEIYPWLPIRLLATNQFANAKRVPEFGFPILVTHGRLDEVVPFHHGERLFDLATEPKLWLEIPGTHNTSPLRLGDEFRETIGRFARGETD